MSTANRRSLEKVTTGDFSGGGILNRQQFEEFSLMAQDSAQILDRVRFEAVDHPKGQIDRLGVGERLLRSATEAQSGTQQTPQTGSINYDMEKVELPWEVSMETVEDTIEGEGTADRLVELFARQFGVDSEDLGVNGDESLADSFLNINDGWITKADNNTDTNTYDHGNATVDKDLFKNLKQGLPVKYRRNTDNLVFLMSEDQKDEYKDYLTDRSTAAGDAMLMSGDEPTPWGIPIETPVGWPDGRVMLTDPMNLVWVAQRNMRMRFTQEGEAVVNRDLYAIYNLLARTDYVIESGNAISLASNVAAP